MFFYTAVPFRASRQVSLEQRPWQQRRQRGGERKTHWLLTCLEAPKKKKKKGKENQRNEERKAP